ncbi:uncharacterized protein [Antedon mediterranea]|uniref:uncharacterized protein n=1 Tax=Antedon mediterranea TaxID=105859 RepID=UPI003AF88CA6
MAESDSGQSSSSSYADWWRYYCQYAQQAQAAQAQQTQGQASTYSTTTTPTTTEQDTYQVNYSAYTSSYTQAAPTSTAATSNYKEPVKDGYYSHSYSGYYSAGPDPIENKTQHEVSYHSENPTGSYANDNAQNAQLENLQKLVAQSVAEAVLKECADINLTQQPMGGMIDKIPPDMEYERSRFREGSWRGRGGRGGRGKNGHSYFDNRHQRDFHGNDDGYWNKRKFNDGGGEYRSRRSDFGRGFRPNVHPRDAFRSNRYDGTNHASDKSPIHVPQRSLGPSNPAAVVQQQIEMMMKGGKSKRPRVYAPPPKSLTNQIYNAMKHPSEDRLKSSEAKDTKKEEKESTKSDDVKLGRDNHEVLKPGESKHDESNVSEEVAVPVGYNPEEKYGEEYIQEVKAFHCHLCGVLLRWQSEVDEHVRSTQHYRCFKNCEHAENTENEEHKEVTKVSDESSENKVKIEICDEHKETVNQELA